MNYNCFHFQSLHLLQLNIKKLQQFSVPEHHSVAVDTVYATGRLHMASPMRFSSCFEQDDIFNSCLLLLTIYFLIMCNVTRSKHQVYLKYTKYNNKIKITTTIRRRSTLIILTNNNNLYNTMLPLRPKGTRQRSVDQGLLGV